MAPRRIRALLAVTLALTLRAAPPPARAADTLGAIAYAGADGNIWTMQPDGTGKQRLTNAAPGQTFGHPRWSPDGSMLVFDAARKVGNYGQAPAGIYLYRDGAVAQIPGLADCARPAFFPDGQRLALACGQDLDSGVPAASVADQLATNPAFGAVSTSTLEGAQWRVLIPYTTDTAFRTDRLSPLYTKVDRIAISPADGALLLGTLGDAHGAIFLGDAGGGALRVIPHIYVGAVFDVDGEHLLADRCDAGCGEGDFRPPAAALVRVGRDSTGEAVLLTLTGAAASRPSALAVSPDGRALAFDYTTFTSTPTTSVAVVALPNGTPRAIADGSAPDWRPAPARECFPQTGKCLQGRFLQYWQQHGGLAINGYPLSDEFIQTLEDGKPYTVQYFERVRMEAHPENAAPYDVELGQFGRRILAGVPSAPTAPATAKDGYTYFAQTGHNVNEQFMAYWNANGGLAQFGYPLTEAFTQQLEDGKSYTVQYFERARFEWHPDNPPPYQVELGQFGRQILAEAGH